MLRILVLGELRVEHDGRALPLPAGRPARALLGLLALHPGRHARAELAARLWPDVLDESARTSLRGALADVRRSLGPAADAHLRATREHVGLVDVWTDAEAAASAEDPEAALALWRGEVLGGLEAGDWLTAVREELRAARSALLAGLAARSAAAGDHATAVARARERVALEPLSEEAHRDLIARLAASGDRAAALTAYARLADRLRTELAIAPSAPTRELVARIRGAAEPLAAGPGERDAAAGPAGPGDGAAAAGPAGPGDGATAGGPAGAAAPPLPATFATRRERSPFVGRDGAQQRLLRVLDGVRDGERRLVFVAGEPGIGKTRLVAETARRAHTAGAVVLAGRCHEEPLGPFAPFVEALRPLGVLRAEPAADAGAARLRFFDEVAALLGGATRGGPVMLVLDDLHWADRATLRLLLHLAGAPEPAALLIVGTYRQTDLGRRHPLSAVLADLRREARTERLALAGLDPEATVRLIGGWVGADTGPELASRVLAETDGNPFFIEEVLRDLVEDGALVRRDGRWRADGSLTVPESVREVIGRRVERLSDAAVGVLEAAAVYGREFDVPALAASGVLPRAALLDGLEEAERAHLVRPAAGARPGSPGRWAFSHALVRDAVYDDLPSLRRARLHAALADTLVRTGGSPAEAAFHAYEAAALVGPDRAVALAREAASEALAGLDYEAAAGHLARALQALELDPLAEPARRAELLIERGEALARAADPGAVEAFSAALALAREARSAELLARAALGACGVGVTIIDVDLDRAAVLEEAIAALGGAAPALRARLLARLAIELVYVPARDRSGPLSAAAVAAARESGDPDALLAALNARHVALWHPDGLEERFAVADEMVALAAAHGRPEDELQGRNWRAVDLWEAADVTGFEAELERHAELADALRLATFRWYAPMWRGCLAALRGEHARARPLIAEAVAIGARAGDRNAELCATMLEVQMTIQERRFERYDFGFATAKIEASPAGPAYRSSRAWALAELGRHDEARADLEWLAHDGFARLPFDFNWLSAVGEMSEAIALLGDAELARALYPIVLPYADRMMAAGRAICSQGSMHHYLGRLAMAIGEPATACRHLAAAIAAQERYGARAWTLQTRGRLAEALAAAGDAERAERELAHARADAEALGLPGAVPLPAARPQREATR
jgi:DNA-binding SARP family transcriptional activator